MRVISMVPSWTETLIEAGVEVVGRTRFCIHPKSNIPIVGGTKDWDWQKIVALKPDLIVLDKEENPKMMAEQKEFPTLATHVSSILDMPAELIRLGSILNNDNLKKLSDEWRFVNQNPTPLYRNSEIEIPALIEWGQKPAIEIKKIIYIIWKNPWMAISEDTFIGSVLEHCGIRGLIGKNEKKYFEIDLQNLTEKENTLLLFSSEPFPFLKKKDELNNLGFPYAFVDGECLSWFGVRSLRFLQKRKTTLLN